MAGQSRYLEVTEFERNLLANLARQPGFAGDIRETLGGVVDRWNHSLHRSPVVVDSDDLTRHIFDAEAPAARRVASIMNAHRALYIIGWAPTMGKVEGEHGPKLGTVGYVFVFGGHHGCSVIVDTDIDLNVTEARLLTPYNRTGDDS